MVITVTKFKKLSLMNNISEIKHIHRILNLLLYSSDSIENITNLKNTISFYANPANDNELKTLTILILKYAMELGAIKFKSIDGLTEFSSSNKNIDQAIELLKTQWPNLQSTKTIEEKNWMVEFWIEWTKDWRNELIKLRILRS